MSPSKEYTKNAMQLIESSVHSSPSAIESFNTSDTMRVEEDYIICKKCQFKITFPDMKTIGDRYNEEKKK